MAGGAKEGEASEPTKSGGGKQKRKESYMRQCRLQKRHGVLSFWPWATLSLLSRSLRDDVYGSLFQQSGSVFSSAGHKSFVSERPLATAGNTESLTFVMLRPSNAEHVSPDRCTNASGGAFNATCSSSGKRRRESRHVLPSSKRSQRTSNRNVKTPSARPISKEIPASSSARAGNVKSIHHRMKSSPPSPTNFPFHITGTYVFSSGTLCLNVLSPMRNPMTEVFAMSRRISTLTRIHKSMYQICRRLNAELPIQGIFLGDINMDGIEFVCNIR
ncbi:hypothetical protein Tco_1468265 [Tanacetum coccineum]